MTNAEKFKEVFGIAIDETPDDPCGIFDPSLCKNQKCKDCRALNFWEKQYKSPESEEKAYRKIESIPYLMHKELDVPISECQKAYDVAIDYLRSQGKIKG